MDDDQRGNGIPEGVLRFEVFASEAADLKELQGRVDAVARRWVEGYMWHLESFYVEVGEREGVGCLVGEVGFGESMEDEWFVVGLLVEVTGLEGVFVHFVDSDGQFLLIEAADVLPEWMDPEGMDNRVFIKSKKVLIIPPTPLNPGQCFTMPTSSTDCPPLPLDTAVGIIRRSNITDFHNSEIEGYLTRKISSMPQGAVSYQTHHVTVTLPTPIAVALTECPQLISHASLTLCHPEPKYTKDINIFNPSKVGTSTCTIRTTKILHAMVSQSRFTPSQEIFQLPVKTDSGYKKSVLGAKIACGFEAAYRSALGAVKPPVVKAEVEEPPQLPKDPSLCSTDASLEAERERTRKAREKKKGKVSGWEGYVKKLEGFGYFEGEMEGSAKWKEKYRQAREYYEAKNGPVAAERVSPKHLPMDPPAASPEPPTPSPAYGWNSDDTPTDVTVFTSKGKFAPFNKVVDSVLKRKAKQMGWEKGMIPREVAFEVRGDDDEGWMTVGVEEMDEMLSKKFDQNISEKLADEERAKARTASDVKAFDDLSRTVQAVSKFIDTESDYRGVTTTSKQPTQSAISKDVDDMPQLIPPEKEDVQRSVEDAMRRQAAQSKKNSRSLHPPKHGYELQDEADEEDDGDDYVPPKEQKWTYDAKKFWEARKRLLGVQDVVEESDEDTEGDGEGGYGDIQDVDMGEEGEGEAALQAAEEYMRKLNEELDAHEAMGRIGPGHEASNLLRNFLESIQAQEGGSGPVSNMLGEMGINLEDE